MGVSEAMLCIFAEAMHNGAKGAEMCGQASYGLLTTTKTDAKVFYMLY